MYWEKNSNPWGGLHIDPQQLNCRKYFTFWLLFSLMCLSLHCKTSDCVLMNQLPMRGLIKGFVCNDCYRVESKNTIFFNFLIFETSNNTNFIHNKSIKPPAYIKQPGTALEMTWTTLHVEVATLVGTVTPESWCHVPPSVVSARERQESYLQIHLISYFPQGFS